MSTVGDARAPQPSERLRGYLEVGIGAVTNGSVGVLVTYAVMPATMLVCLRMAFGAAALGLIVLATGSWRNLRTPGVPLRLLGIGAALALNLVLYFIAIRATGVAVAIFLSYLAPLYLAFVAPRVLHEATDRIVYVSLVVGLVGMAAILVPGLVLADTRLSAFGLLCGWAAGVMYATYLMFGKSLRARRVPGTAVVFSQTSVAAVLLLVPGLVAVSGAHYRFTGRDLLIAAALGLLNTAFAFSIFMDGMRYVRVQHASIVGYLEAVSAPVFALVFLGQVPSSWMIAGGVLIVVAGILVVLFAREEIEPEPVG